MAIGSVYELVDYKKETIKLAKKYGGGTGSAEMITGEYDPTKNPQNKVAYNKGDYVVYNGELYKANQDLMTKAGAFNPEMWDKVEAYDPTKTYHGNDKVVYNGDLYSCIVEETTGEWDASDWSKQFPQSYSPTSYYYSQGTVVENDGDYYVANSSFENLPIGAFEPSVWTETTVMSSMTKVKATQIKSEAGSPPTLVTDKNGIVKINVDNISGYVIGFEGAFQQPMREFCTEIIYPTTAHPGTIPRQVWLKFTDPTTGLPLAETSIQWYMSIPKLIWVDGSDIEYTTTYVTQYVESTGE